MVDRHSFTQDTSLSDGCIESEHTLRWEPDFYVTDSELSAVSNIEITRDGICLKQWVNCRKTLGYQTQAKSWLALASYHASWPMVSHQSSSCVGPITIKDNLRKEAHQAWSLREV